MSNYYLDDKYNILYAKNSHNFYEPMAINFNKVTNECELIKDIPYLMDLISYINFVRRQRNVKDGSFRIIPLFIYQYSSIIDNVIKVLNPMSERVLNSWSRQSGKSESIKLTLGFLQSFGMLYLETKIERFSGVLASHDMKSVKKLFKEIKPYILKGVDLFNSKYINSPIITDKENSRLENNMVKLELNRIIDGEELPWSHIFAITAQAQNDSLSSHCMVVDEAGLVDNHSFEVSCTPFTSTTNAPIFLYGLPTNDSSSFLFQNFLNNSIKNIIYTWEDIYKIRLLTDKKMAEGYKLDFLNRSKGNEKSSYIRWNYYCDFEDSNGKFITRKLLQDNNILVENIEVPENTNKNWIVLGVDVSSKFDFFSITIGEVVFDNYGEFIIKIKYMKTVNKNREHKSMKEKALEITKLCTQFKVDLVTIDSTSHQLYFVQELYNNMKENEVPSQLFPYPFSANGKEKLFMYFESMLYDQKLKLLKEDESWESKKLVEELLYLKKEKKENKITYLAPNKGSGDFSDDHCNSVALCAISYQYAFECSNARKEMDDGEHIWRPRLQKYKVIPEKQAKKQSSWLGMY